MVIHDNPYDIWAKLSWEVNEYELRRTDKPPIDSDGMVYLLQNACVSAVAVVEWLRLDAKRSARNSGGIFEEELFAREVEVWLPELSLARAIANTFKHGEYRDEGLTSVEVKVEAQFDDAQDARLRAAAGTDDFERLFAEEAAEADFRLTFQRSDTNEIVEGHDLLRALDGGALRLLDATFGDRDQFARAREGPSPSRE